MDFSFKSELSSTENVKQPFIPAVRFFFIHFLHFYFFFCLLLFLLFFHFHHLPFFISLCSRIKLAHSLRNEFVHFLSSEEVDNFGDVVVGNSG